MILHMSFERHIFYTRNVHLVYTVMYKYWNKKLNKRISSSVPNLWRLYWPKGHVNIWNLLQPSRWNWFSGCNVGAAIFTCCLTDKFPFSRPCCSTDYSRLPVHVHSAIYMARTYTRCVWHTHLSVISSFSCCPMVLFFPY